MCIVIDINSLAMVFNKDNERHADFSFVKIWIENREGFVVYGGTKYKNELAKTGRYMKLLRLMRDAGQAITIRDEEVDNVEEEILDKTKGTGCDDQHIVALLVASRCPLLCSVDNRSFAFVKDRGLYPKGMPRVKIYTSPKNKALLKKADPKILRNTECCLATA